jgi:dihydrofolate synthase/folylpolyglutamate synthase
MLHSYKEAIEFLYTQLPVFQNIGPTAYKKDITNTIKLCQHIGNPQNNFKSIHIAGTNGKGSSAHMIASVLQSSGYKTGLYTSPHLKDFTERIKINGQPMQKDFVVYFVNKMLEPMEEIKPSFFELTVAMAFEYFAQEKVDFAVIEAGLGGRLDSTNIINPEISLITNIGYDHMDILGDKLETIASEKAGIIKEKIPVVVSERQTEIEEVFIHQANEKHSELIFASDHIHVEWKENNTLLAKTKRKDFLFNPDLAGSYQQKNIKGALQVCLQLKSMGFDISDDNLIRGINEAAALTGLKGR